MSKELIVRLRKFIGGELGNGAADALESLEAAYSGAVEAGKALAKQALKAERERDAFEKAAGEEAKKYLEEREKRIAAEADRDTLAAELKALRVTQQAPTTDDINMQNWKGMDGACAWHLIDRHADDWNHVARLMNAWLEANREDLVSELKALREQEPVATLRNSSLGGLRIENHAPDVLEAGMKLYAHPAPVRELTDEAIENLHMQVYKGPSIAPARMLSFARAIERHLKGEGE